MMAMKKITPCLWFDTRGEEAAAFYTSVFPNSRIIDVARYDEAISFQVSCEGQDEVDYYWTKLSDGGEEGPCGWLKDKFGVSWQIVPTALLELLGDPDQGKAQRVMAA